MHVDTESCVMSTCIFFVFIEKGWMKIRIKNDIIYFGLFYSILRFGRTADETT